VRGRNREVSDAKRLWLAMTKFLLGGSRAAGPFRPPFTTCVPGCSTDPAQ